MSWRKQRRQGEQRVLHVISGLEADGISPWLLELVRQQARMGWPADVCVLGRSRGALAAAFETAGCRILRCSPGLGALVPLRMWQLLARRGPYRALHAHLTGGAGSMTRVGLCLAAARLAGVAVRSVHLHTAPAEGRSIVGVALARRFATVAISPSGRRSAEWAGLTANDGPELVEAPYGTCLGRDSGDTAKAASLRAELGIPRSAPVVGMIGRTHDEVSSAGFLRIAEEIVRIRPETRFVLVGDSAMRGRFLSQARIMDLDQRAFFVRRPTNPNEITSELFDVLLLTVRGGEAPSLLLRAQAAGLLVALSGPVDPRYVVLPQSVVRVAESSGLDGWAAAAVSLLGRERLLAVAASNLVAARGFDAADACRRVLEIYEQGAGVGKVASGRSLAGAPSGESADGWYA